MPSSQAEVLKKIIDYNKIIKDKLKNRFDDYGIRDSDIDGLSLQTYQRHGKYLDVLIKKRELTPKDAIYAIKILNAAQIEWVIKGLSIDDAKELKSAHLFLLDKNFSLEEIRNLSNFHLDTLREQFKYDLRNPIQPQHLANKLWFNNTLQMDVLFCILKKYRLYKIEPTLADIEPLNTHQLKAILEGLDYTEVRGLNEIQIHSLKKLKDYGLTYEVLCHEGDWFKTELHYQALKALMRNSEFYCKNPDQAIDVLRDLKKPRLFVLSKDIPVETEKNLNEYQILLQVHLLQDNTLALDLPTIQECTWFNSKDHYKVFIRLVEEAHFTPREALKKIHAKDATKLKQMLATPIEELTCCKAFRCSIA